MNCPMESRNPEMLVAYGTGKLDLQTAGAFERHMASCANCRAAAEEQAALWKTLDAWEAPAVSFDFDRRLYRRIRKDVRLPWWERIGRTFHLRQVLPLTATAGLLLMAGLILHRPAQVVAPRGETVRAEQMEKALDDLELLQQFGAAQAPPAERSDAM